MGLRAEKNRGSVRSGLSGALLMVLLIRGMVGADINSGLIAYYPFNGDAVDASGNGHNGVMYGATSAADHTGEPGKALGFNGTSSYVSIPDSLPGEARTIAVWAKSNETLSASFYKGRQIAGGGWKLTELAQYQGTGCYTYINFNQSTSGLDNEFVTLAWEGGRSAYYWTTATTSFPTGTIDTNWHHYCFVWDAAASNYVLYMDGVSKGPADQIRWVSGPHQPLRNLKWDIGRSLGSDYWYGMLDEMRVYGRALSQAEVGQLAGLAPGPTLLAPADLGYVPRNSQWTYSWSAVPGATEYELQDGDGVTWWSATTTTNSFRWGGGGLQGYYTPASPYFWKVRAKVDGMYTAWSEISHFCTVAPSISLSSAAVSVGNVNVGSSGMATFAVGNTISTSGALSVTGISVVGADASQFTVNPSTFSINGGATAQTVTVTFAPTSAGSKTASLSIAHNAAGSPSSVQLSGTGQALVPPMLLAPADLSNMGRWTDWTYQWGAVPGATEYQLAEANNPSFSAASLTTYNVTTARGHLDGEYTLSAPFYWRVRAKVNGLYTDWSATWRVITVSPLAPTTITLASDANPSEAGQSVTFTATVSSGAGTPSGSVTFRDGTTSLGNGILNTSGVTTFSTSALSVGSHAITVVYSGDGSFAGSTSEVVVKIVDTTAPVVTAPADVTVEASGPLTPILPASIGIASATDLVDGAVAVVTSNIPASFPLGTTKVIWTATDAAHNIGTATQLVIVVDTTAPVVTAPADITVEATGLLTPILPASIGTASATDLVDGMVSVTAVPPSTFPVGKTVITYTATDVHGNTGTAPQTVTITDHTAPVVTPTSVIAEATSPQGVSLVLALPPATDNVGVVTLTSAVGPVVITSNAPTTFPLGATTVIWTATDAYGNAGTATQLVTVRDSTAPVVTAALTVISRDRDEDEDEDGNFYRVTATATDAVDAHPVVSALITQPLTTTSMVVSYKREKKNRIQIKTERRKLQVELSGPNEPALRSLWTQVLGAGGFSVSDGQAVQLIVQKDKKDEYEAQYQFDKNLKLTSAKGPGLKLAVWACDAAGNQSPRLAVVPGKSARSGGGGRRNDDGDQNNDHRGAKVVGSLPASFGLEANYPNPFNPSTTLRYNLADAGQVQLTVYDVMGQRIQVLVNQPQETGSYEVEWDATDATGRQVAPGLYLYRLVSGNQTAVGKMLLLK